VVCSKPAKRAVEAEHRPAEARSIPEPWRFECLAKMPA
jgi:hypothetical protein